MFILGGGISRVKSTWKDGMSIVRTRVAAWGGDTGSDGSVGIGNAEKGGKAKMQR
jgi:hypothetical protein